MLDVKDYDKRYPYASIYDNLFKINSKKVIRCGYHENVLEVNHYSLYSLILQDDGGTLFKELIKKMTKEI